MKLRRLVGLDIARDEYAYSQDASVGHISTKKVADQWVKTTCGYCSVGCGMLVGTRNGKVVTSRGDPDHPVNRGKLCPKGLAEHYVIEAENRALYPLLRRDGNLQRVSWDSALSTMAAEFRRVAQQHGQIGRAHV